MMNEEFEREKEAEKAHLRKLKELKQMLHGARRLNSTRTALEQMSSESERLLDETSGLTEGMAQEAAIQDARMDMALSSEAERNAGAPSAADLEAREEELRKMRAQELVRQMKSQLGAPGPAVASSTPSAPDTTEASRVPGEKTVGRPAREPEESPKPLPDTNATPEKTIGRMRP